MALRERLVRESGMTGALAEDAISNQQGFQDMKARLHRMLINRMDLTKLGQLEPERSYVRGVRATACAVSGPHGAAGRFLRTCRHAPV